MQVEKFVSVVHNNIPRGARMLPFEGASLLIFAWSSSFGCFSAIWMRFAQYKSYSPLFTQFHRTRNNRAPKLNTANDMKWLRSVKNECRMFRELSDFFFLFFRFITWIETPTNVLYLLIVTTGFLQVKFFFLPHSTLLIAMARWTFNTRLIQLYDRRWAA